MNKLESSYDLSFGNNFGISQIQTGFKTNSLAVSNICVGWTDYFTNNKIGGRLEMEFVKMTNNHNSLPFRTNYFRSTYYLNGNLKNLLDFGKSKKSFASKKKLISFFDCDLGIGMGYSILKSKLNSNTVGNTLNGADDILNFSFRISPSYQITKKNKIFLSYTYINHSCQTSTFDFNNSIYTSAFKGSLSSLNFGIRYTPDSKRFFRNNFKTDNSNTLFKSIDVSFGNHFAGKTRINLPKFNQASISHYNIGANHSYPNTKLYGRFDLCFDIFKGAENSASYSSKYFKLTYQVFADMRLLGLLKNKKSPYDLAIGGGFGFATMYNSESYKNTDDIFLNGDDMYAFVFSVNPSYRLSKKAALILNYSFTSHTLQSRSWSFQDPLTNEMFNGRFMNLSFGLRYYLNK